MTKKTCILPQSYTRRTIFVTEGKDSFTIKTLLSELEIKGGKKENTELISMDMSVAFVSGAMTYLPDSQIVFDKFHLV